MFVHPGFDPVAIHIGPIAIHWYGLMYLIAFIGGYWMLHYRARKQPLTRPLSPEQIGDWLFYAGLGVILGGRLGYCLFYEPELFIRFENSLPWWGVLMIHKGGMSFHGGFLGVLLASWWAARKLGVTFFRMTDFIAPVVPFGLLCGRIGNFINAELWGRVTDLPWAMVFPQSGPEPRHPSMLYEALLEGLLLWALLWWFSSRLRPPMAVSALFLMGYGTFRFLVEFVREPDQQLGFIALDWVTMGQVLSLPMALVGVGMLIFAYRQRGKAIT